MGPLQITARLRSPVVSVPPIDSLLAAVVAQRDGLVPGFGEWVDVEIPIQREPRGRFHLATAALATWDQHEVRHVHQRFPLAEAQYLGETKLRRVHIGAGPCRSYRIPTSVRHAEGDTVQWFAIGDLEAVHELVLCVSHLGKRRAAGRGSVASWVVNPVEPWGQGFPVARDGAPLRTLPADWPGLVDPVIEHAVLTYPYWLEARAELCAVPC